MRARAKITAFFAKVAKVRERAMRLALARYDACALYLFLTQNVGMEM